METKLPPRGDGVAGVVPACVLPLRERCPRRSSEDNQRLSTFLSLTGHDMYASIVKDRVVNQAQCPCELGGRDPSGPLFPDPWSLWGPSFPVPWSRS